MKKSILLLSFICLLIVQGLCQGEGNNWYFGNYAGLNFSTNPPNILTDGHLITSEGCASVSSKSGDLLFYTDGINVWDANHNIMPNGTGLVGHPSSTQSAVICPKPGTYNYALERFEAYYILTIDYNVGLNGIRFSEVDMTLNGGTGDVLVANKNTLLFGTTTVEGANIARHANGCDYWFIGKEVGNNTFKTYYVSPAGVNLTPVISNTGGNTPAAWGSVKVSPNNTLVALANSVAATRIQVFDFNNNTGVLTAKFSDNVGGYSSEFSTDNKILYSVILSDPNIYQYDLTAPNNAAFQASRTIIGTTANTIGYKMCALQMALNGKIYAALQGLDYIGVINYPDTLGVGCNYVDNGQSIAGVNTFSGTNMISVLGLPAFPSFFITQPIEIISQNLCFDDQTVFQISDTADINLIEWTVTDTNLVPITQSTNFELTFQFTNPGQYIVGAIVHYPCFIDSSLIDTITITYVAPANLGNDTSLCQGQSIILDAGTGYDYYIWHNGYTSQTFLADTSGQYIVQVMNQACTKTDTINITVSPIPIAAFTFSNECFGTPIQFTDSSTIPAGSITGWSWDFGDGSFSTDTNPAHSYSLPGNYPVKLIVTNNLGCKDTVTKNVEIAPLPVADYSFTKECLTDTTQFIDLSTVSSGSVNTWYWDFGDGSPISNLQNNIHVYADTGFHTVTFIVTTDKGCLDTIIRDSIEVFPPPVVDFQALPECFGNATQFTDLTSFTVVWDWDFGDGDTSDLLNPTHLYTDTFTSYTVTLIATTQKGCYDTIEKNVTVYPKPAADFGFPVVCRGDTTWFIDSSSVSGGSIVSWDWDFGLGNTSALQSPPHVFAVCGFFPTILMVADGNNCKDTITKAVRVYCPPSAEFDADSVCYGDTTTFTDQSFGAVITWSWDFGDADTSALQNSVHLYNSPGLYNVVLTVTDTNGCVDSSPLVPVEVYSLPIADFSASPVCLDAITSFTDQSTPGSGNVTGWNWNFGDTNTDTLNNPSPSHTYATSDTFIVRLIVTTNNGCIDDTSRMVTVNPKPMANFDASTVCFGGTTPFKDSSTVSSGSITAWAWDFGDGGNDTVKDPIHQYNRLTTFNVQLIVTTDNGCTDTLPKNINVYQKSFAAFSTDTVCSGNITQFTDISNAPGENTNEWFWNFGDVGVGDTSKNPLYLYPGSGTYSVYLVAITDSGCIDTIIKTVKVNPNPVTTISQLIHTTLGECDGIAEIIPGGGIRPYTFAWDSSGVTIQTDSLALNLCPGTFIVTTTDANGCFRIDTVIISDGCGLNCDKIYHGISPNADEINDTWVIINIANCIPNKVTIYNRWGDLVWKGKDYDNEAVIWDGFNKNSRRLPDGTYFYIIEVDNERTCQGWVQIMR